MLQRTPGTSYVSTYLRGPAPLNTALDLMNQDLRQLTREEYEATFREPMRDVTTTADEVVELWPYAEQALRALFPHVCNCAHDVEAIYETGDSAYQHVLIPSHEQNVYLSVIVDKPQRSILGHYRLDLNALYGFAPEV